MEIEKSEISEINQKLEEKVSNLENEIDSQLKKFTKEIENLEKINLSFKEKNGNLSNMNDIKRNLLIENDIKIKEIDEYYKKNIDKLEKELYLKQKIEESLKEKLENLLEKEENLLREIDDNRIKNKEELTKLEKQKFETLQENILIENNYKKMIKDLEVLIYKINLENFDLKESLDRNRRDKNSNSYDYNIYDPYPTMSKEDFNNKSNKEIIGKEQENFQTEVKDINNTDENNNVNNFSQNEFSNYNTNIHHLFNSIDIDKEINNIESMNNLKKK